MLRQGTFVSYKKNMKKMLFYGLLLCLLLVGCTSSSVGEYTNLSDESTRKEVATQLLESGLLKENVDKVMNYVQDFNIATIDYTYKDGYNKLPKGGVDYSTLLLDENAQGYNYLQWLNCRLTAFNLIKDQISTTRDGNELDSWIMFDVEAINTIDQLKLNDEQKQDFITLFNQIDIKGCTTIEQHEEAIKKAWATRNIKLNNENISLVCVYLHAPEDDARFVGHTGILLNSEDGVLFFEKYSNLAPFQVSKFKDTKELKDYLLSRPDLYGDGSELAPIVTINNEIL